MKSFLYAYLKEMTAASDSETLSLTLAAAMEIVLVVVRLNGLRYLSTGFTLPVGTTSCQHVRWIFPIDVVASDQWMLILSIYLFQFLFLFMEYFVVYFKPCYLGSCPSVLDLLCFKKHFNGQDLTIGLKYLAVYPVSGRTRTFFLITAFIVTEYPDCP